MDRLEEDGWEALWDDLVTVPYGLYRELEDRLEAGGNLSGLRFRVAQALASAPEGRLRLQELAESIHLSPSGTTRLVDKLEAEGLLRRHACPLDRRATWASLTEEGRRAFNDARPLWEAFLAERLRVALSPEEGTQLHALLAKLSARPRCPKSKGTGILAP